MDFVTYLPHTSRRHDAVWVIVDRLIKSTHFLAVRMTFTLEKFCRLYVREIVSRPDSRPDPNDGSEPSSGRETMYWDSLPA